MSVFVCFLLLNLEGLDCEMPPKGPSKQAQQQALIEAQAAEILALKVSLGAANAAAAVIAPPPAAPASDAKIGLKSCLHCVSVACRRYCEGFYFITSDCAECKRTPTKR